MLKHAPGVRYERNRAFRRIVRDFETVADVDFTPSERLRDVLRPYQEEGFKWLCTLGAVEFGGILGDEMGLGKTLQTIAYLEQARDAGEERPAIVVCPASLVYNWRSEFERFAPSMAVMCVTGDKRRRREAIAVASEADVLVTSYDLLRRDVGDYEGTEFSCAILDEAQFVKNHNTQAAKRFQAGEAPVFLISLKAGGTGLNLTAADIVIHYDPWWNLAAQNQATDRTHRIGQDKEVSVFKLIAKDTVEEKIVALQEAKQDLADSVLSGEAAGSASITRDDLLAFLGTS